MLIPRFSLRWLLGLTVVCSLYFLVVAQAVRGEPWAIAASLAVAALMLAFLLQMLVFLFTVGLARLLRLGQARERPSSPFATSRPPPQVLSPREPD